MRTNDHQPQSVSRTIDSNPKASRQAPMSEILQAYTNVPSNPIQMYGGITADRIDNKDEIALNSEESVVAAADESDVVLVRGIILAEMIDDGNKAIPKSFVSLSEMISSNRNGNDESQRVDEGQSLKYVNTATEKGPKDLIEFTTSPNIALNFTAGGEGYRIYVKIKKKYLQKAAGVAEVGWMAKQVSPYEILRVEKINPNPEPNRQVNFDELSWLWKRETIIKDIYSHDADGNKSLYVDLKLYLTKQSTIEQCKALLAKNTKPLFTTVLKAKIDSCLSDIRQIETTNATYFSQLILRA